MSDKKDSVSLPTNPSSGNKQTQNKDRTYLCTFENCDKNFSRSDALRRHQKTIHANQPNIPCPEVGCTKKFRRSDNLDCHMRAHRGEKPHTCGSCSAAYADPRNLKNHQSREHGGHSSTAPKNNTSSKSKKRKKNPNPPSKVAPSSNSISNSISSSGAQSTLVSEIKPIDYAFLSPTPRTPLPFSAPLTPSGQTGLGTQFLNPPLSLIQPGTPCEALLWTVTPSPLLNEAFSSSTSNSISSSGAQSTLVSEIKPVDDTFLPPTPRTPLSFSAPLTPSWQAGLGAQFLNQPLSPIQPGTPLETLLWTNSASPFLNEDFSSASITGTSSLFSSWSPMSQRENIRKPSDDCISVFQPSEKKLRTDITSNSGSLGDISASQFSMDGHDIVSLTTSPLSDRKSSSLSSTDGSLSVTTASAVSFSWSMPDVQNNETMQLGASLGEPTSTEHSAAETIEPTIPYSFSPVMQDLISSNITSSGDFKNITPYSLNPFWNPPSYNNSLISPLPVTANNNYSLSPLGGEYLSSSRIGREGTMPLSLSSQFSMSSPSMSMLGASPSPLPATLVSPMFPVYPQQDSATLTESKDQEHKRARFPFSFLNCNKTFASKQGLKRHNKIHDPEQYKHICEAGGCGQKFLTPHQLKSHAKSHKSKKLFVCDQCSKTYVREKFLEKHKLKAHPEISNMPIAPNLEKNPDWNAGLSLHLELLNKLGYNLEELWLLNKLTSDPRVFSLLEQHQEGLLTYKISPLLIRGILFSENCRQSIQNKITQNKKSIMPESYVKLMEFMTTFFSNTQSFCQSSSSTGSNFSEKENASLDLCLDNIFNLGLIPSLEEPMSDSKSSLNSTGGAESLQCSSVVIDDEKHRMILSTESLIQERQVSDTNKSALTQLDKKLEKNSSSSSILDEKKGPVSSKIPEKLQQYSISQPDLKQSLQQKGFSEKLAKKLSESKKPIYLNNLNYVLAKYETLKELSSEKIELHHLEKLIFKNGCTNNIDALIKYFPELQQQFTVEAIMRMVSHNGGSKNLAAVKNAYKELQGLNFTTHQIVNMASHDGGSKNLAAVKNAYKELQGLNFTTDQIVQMVSHHGGSKNLAAVKNAYKELQGLNFTTHQIVQMVSHHGGSKNLAAVKNAYKELQGLNFTTHQIVNMASHDGGSKNLAAVKNAYKELQGLNFTTHQIVQMVSHGGGSKNLAAVKNTYKELQTLNFTTHQIVNMVSHNGGSKNLAAVKNAYKELQGLKFTTHQIVQMVSHGGGSKNLAAVKNAYKELQGLNFTTDQIVQMVSHHGGSLNIQLIQKHHLELKQYQFSPKLLLSLMQRGRIRVEKMKAALEKVASSMQKDSFQNLNQLIANLEVGLQPNPSTGETLEDSISDEKEGNLEQAFNQELERWIASLRTPLINPSSGMNQTAYPRFFSETKAEPLTISPLNSDTLNQARNRLADEFSNTEDDLMSATEITPLMPVSSSSSSDMSFPQPPKNQPENKRKSPASASITATNSSSFTAPQTPSVFSSSITTSYSFFPSAQQRPAKKQRFNPKNATTSSSSSSTMDLSLSLSVQGGSRHEEKSQGASRLTVNKCDFPGCGKEFSRRFTLKRHKEMHNKPDKKHVCGTCSKKFMETDQLKRHIQTHTGKKPFPCDQCNKTYADKSNLISHKEKVHNI